METASQWKSKGDAAFKSGQFKDAVTFFGNAIKQSPNDHVLFSNRSGAHASMGSYREALADANKCVALKADWAKGYSRKGFAHLQLGEIKEAIEAYKKGLEMDPENQVMLSGLKNAMEQDPDQLNKQRARIVLQYLLKKPKFAAYCKEDSTYAEKLETVFGEVLKDPANLQLALAMCPDTRIKEGLMELLGLPQSEANPDEEREKARAKARAAKEAEEKARTQKEELNRLRTPAEIEADRWKCEGNSLYKQRKFNEALEAYNKAIAADPNDLTFNTNKAAVYLEMGSYEACLAECQKALDRRFEVKADYDKVAKIFNRMAVCYQRMGQLEDAIKMYEKSLMEDNNRHIRTALADVKRLKEKQDRDAFINPELAEEYRLKGNALFKSNEFPEAKKEYDEAILRNPADARLYANRAATLMKLLELPGALKDVEKSLELDPLAAKVWARKGNIHSLMKEYNKAMTAFQKGLEIDSKSAECQTGLNNVLQKIQESTCSDKVDEEQVKHAMADPEIQALLADPQFRLTLNQLQENPSKMIEALKNPTVASGIRKLMAAGILKMA